MVGRGGESPSIPLPGDIGLAQRVGASRVPRGDGLKNDRPGGPVPPARTICLRGGQ